MGNTSSRTSAIKGKLLKKDIVPSGPQVGSRTCFRLCAGALLVLLPASVRGLPTQPDRSPFDSALTAAPASMRMQLGQVRFIVIDPVTRRPIRGASVTVEDADGSCRAQTLYTNLMMVGPTPTLDLATWKIIDGSDSGGNPSRFSGIEPNVILITVVGGTSLKLQGQTPQPPIRDITIIVRATLLRRQATSPSVVINQNTIKEKTGAGSSPNKLIEGLPSVASDSAGQEHVRGEHAEIAYVVDGIQLPDTLSGRQGSIVVPSTIQSLSFLTGAYAPEFGGQTAAILDITTLPGAKKAHADLELDGGEYDTTNGNLTFEGPFGKRASYVFNVQGTRTRNALEPQQPDNQTAHNAGSDQSYFGKFRYQPSRRDTLTLTLSSNPSTLQINNRTGLGASFAAAGQGFGFLGLRNRDGSRPDVTQDNADALGAQSLLLPSQQADRQDITQREVNEFAILAYNRQLSSRDSGQLAVTFLHSGQDVRNQNPGVNVLNLPVDNSIEYNPTAVRNVHHVQITGSMNADRGAHRFKTGFLLDDQNGSESYDLVPDSMLALDALANLASNLAPAGALVPKLNAQGAPIVDAKGKPIYVTDVNGNPVYAPTSGVVPNLHVHRTGFYRAAYAQDTWKATQRLNINYGVRADWYKQSQNLGQTPVDTIIISPRANFSYTLNPQTSLRASYNRLFNTPPLAQGTVVGAPILPEILDQYELSIEHQLAPNQRISLAYYYKDIRNQVDTGLLIPGSQIGLYSALNFQKGGVHGIEFAYNLLPGRDKNNKLRSGIDSYFNYTYSTAAPNGVDNTGARVPIFNDHDQRNTIGFGLAYDWRNGAAIGLELQHGSGLASSVVPPNPNRTPRTQVNLHANLGSRTFQGRGGLSLEVQNLFDDRTVINFQSGFSGTRFQQARRIILSLSGSF